MAKMRVLLAYSGGLDTSIIVPWLKENYDCDVVCVAGDVGQGEELEPLHEKAKKYHTWTKCVLTPPSRQKKA